MVGPRAGFFPLSSSVVSSEPDYESTARETFGPLSANVTAATLSVNTLRELPKSRPPSKFSFSSIPAKRPRRTSISQENRQPDYELKRILLQPVNTKETAPLMSYEELEDLLSQPNIPELNYPMQSASSELPLSTIPADLDDIESLFMAESTSVPNGQLDPFFGAPCNYPISNLAMDTPRPTEGRRLVTVHEISKLSMSTPMAMQIKVVPKKPNPITPNFSRKIAVKAMESKDRSKTERRQYNQFLRQLCDDENADDSEDDAVFDIVAASGESDDGMSDRSGDCPSISARELFELFTEAGSIPDEEEEEEEEGFCDPLDRLPVFDEGFVKTLNRQVNVHFQLLSQSLALSGEIKDADQVWVATLKLMIRIKAQIDGLGLDSGVKLAGSQGLELLMRILRQSPLHEALLLRIHNIKRDPDLRIRASVDPIPFIPKHQEGKSVAFSKSFWHVLSIFGDATDPEFLLVPKNSTSGLFDHQASCTLSHLRRHDSFMPCEDRLLLLGLRRHGLRNWEKIKAFLLPTRTAKQLATRFKNLTTRRCPQNPIKEFVNEVMKPLSEAEEELLAQGVRTYKDDWVSISMRFLPHRPATVLKRLWIKHNRRQNYNFLDVYFPSEDEQDSDYQEIL